MSSVYWIDYWGVKAIEVHRKIAELKRFEYQIKKRIALYEYYKDLERDAL